MIVFVVEGDADQRSFMELLLSEHSVRVFSSARCALEAMRVTVPHVFLCDLALPDMTGEDVAAVVASMQAAPRIVLMSRDLERLHRARPLAHRVIRRPFSLLELSEVLQASM